MTKKQIVTGIKNIDNLANAIQHTNEYFLNRVQKLGGYRINIA